MQMKVLPPVVLAVSCLVSASEAAAAVLWKGDFETGDVSQWDWLDPDQDGRSPGSFLGFAGPAARRVTPRVVRHERVLDLAPKKIFFDWSSNQKMRFLLLASPRLPGSLLSRRLSTRGQPHDSSPKRSIGAALGRHSSFCKRAAVGQHEMWIFGYEPLKGRRRRS